MEQNNYKKKRLFLRVISGGIVALPVFGFALFFLSALRLGLSLRAQFLRVVILPRYFRKSPDELAGMDTRIAEDRARGAAHPSPAFRAKFSVREDSLNGQLIYFVAPRENTGSNLRLIYLHGGAYIYDLVQEHWVIVEELVERTGASAAVPLYPLAPEHNWQTAFSLVDALYRQLVEEVGAGNVVIAGDSAGGGLSLAFAQELRDRQKPLPAALVLFSPWLDATVCDPRQVELEKKDVMLSIPTLQRAGRMWAGATPPEDPHISPLFGCLDGLPPVAVFTGSEDLLYADARRLAEKAKDAAITLSLYEYPHEFHVWMAGLPRFIPEARRALDQAAEFIKAHTRRTP